MRKMKKKMLRMKPIRNSLKRTVLDGSGLPMKRNYVRRGAALGTGSAGALALGATAVGALAVGAAAIGALAIGVLSIRKLRLLEGKLENLSIRRLTIGELYIQSRRGSEEP
jgi:hypothetical protein